MRNSHRGGPGAPVEKAKDFKGSIGKLQVDGRAKTHPCHGQCPAGQCVPYLGYAVPLHRGAAGRVPPSAHPL